MKWVKQFPKQSRSSRLEVIYEEGVLRMFLKIYRKKLQWCPTINQEQSLRRVL